MKGKQNKIERLGIQILKSKNKPIMKKITLLLFIITSSVSFAQGTKLEWAKSMGGTSGTSSESAYSIAIDASGNVYTTGHFEGTVDFDPGAGVSNLTSAAGYQDIFISKLDANGNFVWAKRMGGTSYDIAYSIAIDAAGNVYTTGHFFETADFDPGAGVSNLTSAGSWDIFISKLDANGNFVWAKRMGGTSPDEANSIAIDASGNAYTTGFFNETVDFDPGAGVSNLTSAGEADIFISKLDANGNFVWAKRMGGTSVDKATSIAIDAAGNVYTTGYFYGTVDFDPGAGVSNLTSAGQVDIFISKLSLYDLSLSMSSTNEPISIYPNPTEGNLTIDFKNKPFSKIEIYSLAGQKVKEVTEYESIKNGKINLNIANLEPSIYLVKIGETNFMITKQ